MTADLFGFQPSPQQAAFLDFAASGNGNAVLEACAGAGKTSTLTQGVGQMRGTKFLGAFNSSIAAELQKRIGSADPASRTAIASTMHSAGYAAWRQRHPKATVLRNKTRKVFHQLAAERSFDHSARYADYVDEMVSYAMNAGLGLDDPREVEDDKRWQAISNHFDADRSLDKRTGANEQIGIRWARLTLKRSLEMCPELVTFDEMLYAPLHSGVRIQRFDNVLIDEAQDSNVPRILLAERMLAEGGRLFAVGDRHQSIYGFAGADASAMQTIVKRFNCTVLPLSVSFRCPRAVVLYAQQFAGLDIEPAPDAEEGISRRICLYPGWWRDDKPKPHDAILCRFNAPLVGLAFAFLREGIPCRMAGRNELGAALKQLAKRGDSRTIDTVEARLKEWLAEEIKVATLRDKPARANAAYDMVDTMQAIIDRCRAMRQ
jgi:DNA helicase-2/ATP-dependent DNA helicase PcrA